MLEPLDEHQLLVFWTQLFALFVFARALGGLMRRAGLPSVIGELGAGFVLGPSVFGKVWPSGFDWFLPDDAMQSGALLAVSWIGVGLLLVVTGFETDLDLIRKLGRPAAIVTAGSLVLPFAGGLVVGLALPALFLADGANRTPFALFVAAALSVSSLAVVAKILSELGLMRRDFGQITVAAGMANDVIGWLMLGVFTGLAASGEVSAVGVVLTVGGILVFLVAALTVGQRGVDLVLREVRRRTDTVGGPLTVAVGVTLLFAVSTALLEVEAVLGAFVAGVVLHRSRFQHEDVLPSIERITLAFFAPIFFATAGLRVDLGLLDSGEVLVWVGIIIGVAIVAKFIGAYVGARLAGRSHLGGIALGAGLNARGALEIVIATVGATVGVFNDVSFTAIVLVPVVTSVFAAVTLRVTVRRYVGSPDELARLAREEALSRNLVVRSTRILLPTRGGPSSIAAAQVLHFAWPPEAACTVLTTSVDGAEVDVAPLRNVLHERQVEFRRVRTADPVRAIVDESRLGFGVIGLGAEDPKDVGRVISPLVDGVLSESPITVVLVRRGRVAAGGLPGAFARALVPVAGSPASRAAQEIAFNLSSNLGTEIHVAHVVSRDDEGDAVVSRLFGLRAPARSTVEAGELVLKKATDLAQELGVEPKTALRRASSAAGDIVNLAGEIEADLVVMGATLRRLGDRPFLGHNVEQVLQDCDATVVVVLVPFDL